MAAVLTRDDYIKHIIPYRMKAVSAFGVALKYVMSWQSPRALKIYFDDKLSIQGTSAAYTNPVIETGIMHCRALLEFCGIKCDPKRPNKLIARERRLDTDLVIEDFTGPNGPLQKVTIGQAIAAYGGPAEEAERSLAAVIRTANRGIAHTTVGHVVDGDSFRDFEIASRGVPVIVVNAFYVPLGLKPPDFEIPSSRRGNA